MSTVADSAVTETVRQQYEDFPYPTRNPRDEDVRLVASFLDELAGMNHHLYGGGRDFHCGFRALVAGGGTGDATIYLAHQLQQTDAQIVHVDLSAASMRIAQQRATRRGLEKKITFVNGSLIDLPRMNLGQFDYINCGGVLHHLENPPAGLAAWPPCSKTTARWG